MTDQSETADTNEMEAIELDADDSAAIAEQDAVDDLFAAEGARLERQTDEGAQQLMQQSEIVVTGGPWPEVEGESQTMVINMGPQHPSTHGVLRIMMELDGETVRPARSR